MLEKIMRRYAMSREGAKGFINSVCACTVSDLVLMFPVGLLYTLTEELLNNGVNSGRILFYIIGIIISLLLIYITQFWQYNATFFSTYKESGVRRITLAETLRKLPLSFFGKKDLSDLTTTILNDCTVIEHIASGGTVLRLDHFNYYHSNFAFRVRLENGARLSVGFARIAFSRQAVKENAEPL